MRVSSSTLLALIAATAPVFSAKIANPLTIDVVTSWGEGVIAGYSLWDLTTNRARVDDGIYQRVESFGPFEKEVFGVNFGVQRNVGDDHYYICTASVIEDPGVSDVFLVIEGEDDQFTYKTGGGHEKEVSLKCEKKFYDVKDSS